MISQMHFFQTNALSMFAQILFTLKDALLNIGALRFLVYILPLA